MPSTPFQVEAWAEYAVGIMVLFSRIAYRIKLVGRNWQGDDYFAVAAVFFLTGELVMLELIGEWGSIVGMTEETALSLSDEQKNNIVKGAKANLAGWCLYITLIWCLKACILFFYRRLTLATRQKQLVPIAAVACALSYIATIGVVLLRCLPFYKNWQIYPIPEANCSSPDQIFLALVVTNVSTDLLILYIPLPILWIVQLPLSRKVVYAFWLTTGIFIIVASLLRCILSLKDASEIDVSTIWAIRETFVGVISVNAPILGPPLIRKCSFIAQTMTSKSQTRTDTAKRGKSSATTAHHSYRLDRLNREPMKSDSEEHIVNIEAQDFKNHATLLLHPASSDVSQNV